MLSINNKGRLEPGLRYVASYTSHFSIRRLEISLRPPHLVGADEMIDS